MKITFPLVAAALIGLPSLLAQPDPQKFREDVMKNGMLHNSGYGEQFCWGVNYSADYFVRGYKAFGDPEWIQQGQEYFDWAISKMQKDPDGYPGWIGPSLFQDKNANAQFHSDTVVGDSIIMVSLLGWAETVLKDPKLKARFGKKAQEYIDLAKTVCWDKFNARGQFYQDAAGWVSYSASDKMVRLEDWKWQEFPGNRISENLNKHYDLAHALIRLYRLTGNEEFKKRAIAVFGRAKSMFRYYRDGDRYVWNFWMPHAPYDIEGQAPRSWVSVHPSRAGYQAGEADMFVEAYDSGLVFTEEDIDRIGRTNAWMGANNWVNAEGGKSGTVWPALARFNPDVARFYETNLAGARGDRGEIDRAYYEKVVKKEGKKRLYRQPAPGDLVNVPLKDGEHLSMAQAIPDKIELANNDRLQLVTKTRKGGELKVEVLDATGKSVLGTIYTATHSDKGQYDAPLWDGSIPGKGSLAPGKYTLRWNFEGDVRTEPVWIEQGTKRASTGPEVIQKGQTFKEDFEGALSPRWKVVLAAPSSEQAFDGNQSLKVERSAEFIFGEDKRADLPVRVSMQVYDSGATGGKSGDGPIWGIQTTLGDKFVFRNVWRGYVDGNRVYSWFNTAENQFFSPHPSALRKPGWRQWVFDFTTSPAQISVDGETIGKIDPKWLPAGAVSVFLQNGNPGGPLFVDDVEVTYPQ